MRVERDLLGELEVPEHALYGVQTQRAKETYRITGVTAEAFPELICSFALVKKACAETNFELGLLPRDVCTAICAACDEIALGQHHQNFVVDMIQGGAGTSTNMNCNEVIANRANELLGHPRGSYAVVHPNDHVNKSQSTNDVYPSACKLALVLRHQKLVTEISLLLEAFRAKGREFEHVVKMGRTQLQDAVPMTLGMEFEAFAATLESDLEVLRNAVERFFTLNLGGTAVGTGIAAPPRFGELAVEKLGEEVGLPLRLAGNLIEATSSTGSFLLFSGILRRVAVKLSKICNDLRLLASGPRTGLGEITLPALAPGSSIMPGKINPVVPEVVNQVCFSVIGADVTVTMASEAAQLQLNVMEPVIVYKTLESLEQLERAAATLREKCVVGIEANEERCMDLVRSSIGVVTALLPAIGYKNASAAAARALAENRGVGDVIVEMGLLSVEEVKDALRPERMLSNAPLTVANGAAAATGNAVANGHCTAPPALPVPPSNGVLAASCN